MGASSLSEAGSPSATTESAAGHSPWHRVVQLAIATVIAAEVLEEVRAVWKGPLERMSLWWVGVERRGRRRMRVAELGVLASLDRRSPPRLRRSGR